MLSRVRAPLHFFPSSRGVPKDPWRWPALYRKCFRATIKHISEREVCPCPTRKTCTDYDCQDELPSVDSSEVSLIYDVHSDGILLFRDTAESCIFNQIELPHRGDSSNRTLHLGKALPIAQALLVCVWLGRNRDILSIFGPPCAHKSSGLPAMVEYHC